VLAAAEPLRAGSAEAAVFRAALSQRAGESVEAERLLSKLSLTLSDADREILIDLHVPMLISMGRIDRAEHVLGAVNPQSASERAGVAALSAVIAAHRGDVNASNAAAARAQELLVFIDDDFRRATVLQRLSLAAFYNNSHLAAMDLALASVRVAETAGFMRYAAIAYTVPFAIAHDVYADPRLALYYAERTMIVGQAAGDETHVGLGLAMQAIVAAESGDRSRLESLKANLMTRRQSKQFREEWVLALALAVPLAWDGQFEQFGAAIAAIRDGRNASERALCDALLAVCSSVRDDIEEARRKTRSALHLTRRLPGAPAFDEQRRRVARAIAAVVCMRIGDHIRAQRALAGKDMAGTPEASLADEGRSAPIVAGWKLVLGAAERVSKSHVFEALLTPAQVVLLRELAFGKSIPQISKETGRSVATLRTHAQQINERLGVHGRAAALARGRELGLI
jgi:DNA-binding CsgD family transcriptional regulator